MRTERQKGTSRDKKVINKGSNVRNWAKSRYSFNATTQQHGDTQTTKGDRERRRRRRK